MTPETARRLALLTSQLAETLMTAALCAEEIRAAVLAELDDDAGMWVPPPEEVAQAFAAHNMTVVGPPLEVD